jgi:hypothetical protein
MIGGLLMPLGPEEPMADEPNKLGVAPLPNLANADGAPNPTPLLMDANGDLAAELKALPSTGFGFSSEDSDVLAAVSVPNELAPARDVPNVPKGEVDD